MMKQSGLNLDIVSNGVEAIESLSKTDYALVLMDCLMPVTLACRCCRFPGCRFSGLTSLRINAESLCGR